MTGAAIEIPAIAATVWGLSWVGIGDPDVTFMHVLRLTTVFAGIAAVLTAGGIGRLGDAGGLGLVERDGAEAGLAVNAAF